MKFLGIILLIALFAVIDSSTFEKSSITAIEDLADTDSRIINGLIASPGQFPWQAIIKFWYGNGYSFCGGSLICDSWVLTAAHCVKDASHFTISLGTVNYTQQVEPGRIVLSSKRALYHRGFVLSNLVNDIALIELSQRVRFTDKIRPIPLGRYFVDAGNPVTVSGWGKTREHSGLSPRLRYAVLETISNKDCSYYYHPSFIRAATLCCKEVIKKNTCNGDSGGPLVIQNQNREYVHVGIVSFVSSNGCEAGIPSGYVRTANYIDWIFKTIDGTCTLPNPR